MSINREKQAESSAVVRATLFVLLTIGLANRAYAARVVFQISRGLASATLRQFADQSHMNILFASDKVGNQKTHAVAGELEPIEALSRMLAGSGLDYQLQEPDSVLVRASGGDAFSGGDVSCERAASKPCSTALLENENLASTVTVTGTLIHTVLDSGALQVVTPNITLTREELETGGFQTVGEALRNLPQNFGGGLNLGVIFAGGNQNITSQSAASTANLRGLGSDSTLVLINGQRRAGSEWTDALDLTLIPISAIERIDITTGSASARYGSDAVAGVVNIITRSHFQGVEASSTGGAATEGGSLFQHYSVVAGHNDDVADVSGVVDCARQQEIDSQERSYIPADIAGTTLMPGMERCSEILSAVMPLPNRLEISVLGAFTNRSAHQAQRVAVSGFSSTSSSSHADVDQYAVDTVLQQHFLKSWTATLSAGLSADDVSSRELLRHSGAPDEYATDQLDNRLWTAQLVTSGTLAEMPAGPAQLTAGAGYDQQSSLFGNSPGGEFNVAKWRRVRFGFIESTVPLVPSTGSRDFAALTLDVAVRRERYSEVGSTTNSKISLTLEPASDVKVRASWGTSFRAPTLFQQSQISQAVLELVPDAANPAGQSLALLRYGGNASLKSEVSSDIALDLTVTPEALLPGATLQIGYFNILYRQRIGYPTLNTGNPLSDPNVGPFVSRNPTPGSIAQILSESQFTDLTLGQFPAQEAELIIDDRTRNFARQRASGVDVLWKYGCETAFGKWDTSLNTTYLDLQQQLTSYASIASLSGTVFYPPVWRGRFGVNWGLSRYLGALFVNYTGGSRDVNSPGQPSDSVLKLASWSTLDGQIGMVFDGGAHWRETKLTLSAQNMLDRHPPLYSLGATSLAGVNYDSTNASPVGRFVTLQVKLVW